MNVVFVTKGKRFINVTNDIVTCVSTCWCVYTFVNRWIHMWQRHFSHQQTFNVLGFGDEDYIHAFFKFCDQNLW